MGYEYLGLIASMSGIGFESLGVVLNTINVHVWYMVSIIYSKVG